MITTLILLCLTTLDFQRPAIPDSIEKQFVVTELIDQTTTGCASSPQTGRQVNHQIVVDVVNNDDPHDSATIISTSSPLNHDTAMDAPLVQAIMPHDPPGLPNPNPDPPPIAATPEPPTVAILGISLAALMYLLFGRRKKQKLYRRT